MKKKAKKRLMEQMAIAAFALQLAEFGIEVWNNLKQKGKDRSLIHSNGRPENADKEKIIVPA